MPDEKASRDFGNSGEGESSPSFSMKPLRPEFLTTFQPTRFGKWVVKLSYTKGSSSLFLLIAYHVDTLELMIRTFEYEMEVINFVSFLGERHE